MLRLLRSVREGGRSRSQANGRESERRFGESLFALKGGRVEVWW